MPEFCHRRRCWPFACNSLKTGHEHEKSRGQFTLFLLVGSGGYLRSLSWIAARFSRPASTSSRATFGSTRHPRPRSCTTVMEISCSRSRARIARTLPLDRVSPAMISAVLAAEDRHFFRHAGMDLDRRGASGLGRSEGARGQAGRQHHHTAAHPPCGALARSELPAQRSKRRCSPFGSNAGSTRKRSSRPTSIVSISATVTTASKRRPEATSASRPPSSRVADSALLAGIIPCPSVCSPRISLDIARNRRNNVLRSHAQKRRHHRAGIC